MQHNNKFKLFLAALIVSFSLQANAQFIGPPSNVGNGPADFSTVTVGNCTNITTVFCVTGGAKSDTLALGGATIGSNALAVTGTSQFNGDIYFSGTISSFPKFSRSGTTIKSLLADGSDFTFLRAKAFVSSNAGQTAGNSIGQTGIDGEILFTNIDGTILSVLSLPSNDVFQIGKADTASPVAQTLQFQNGSGTNIAGVNATIIGSLATGTGNSGDIIFQTGVKTISGSTLGTKTTALTIKGETQLVNAAVGFAQGANTGIVSCSVATLGATITIKGGIVTAFTGC